MFSGYLAQAPWMVSFSFVLSELTLKLSYYWEREKDVILLGNNFNLYATFFPVLSTSDKGNRLIDVFSGITDANYEACAKLLCSS